MGFHTARPTLNVKTCAVITNFQAQQQKGVIKLVPIKERRRCFSKLFGMLENSNLSTEEFCKQKQIDK